jgi:thiol-disulfide isomerase/thioredoxin
MAMGAVMVLVAFAMLGNYDIRFQSAIASDLPSFLVNPTKGLEDSAAAKSALADLRTNNANAHGVGARATEAPAPVSEAEDRIELPDYGPAPEFVDTQDWFNTPGGAPLGLNKLHGRVVLIDFWTYSCINCLRTLPYLEAWDKRYRKDGLTIIGVHTPEFPFERVASNVQEAIDDEGIAYPVVQDNEQGTWNAYGNQYWPAEYFVDAKGEVRFVHFGEGEYDEKEQVIRQLLAEAGESVGGDKAKVRDAVSASRTVTTPETYLGVARAERFTNPTLSPGLHDLEAPAALPDNEFAYHGKWRIGFDSVTAAGGSLDLNFGARRVYLVLGSPTEPRRVKVMLDGEPISPQDAGADVSEGYVTVDGQRLYNLVSLSGVEHHVLELQPEAGVMAYAFTFG